MNTLIVKSLTLLREQLATELQGKNELIEKAVACFLAGGHLLLEGPPGTGKTSLAKNMAALFGGSFHRIQMTSDLLPSDVTGTLRMVSGTSDLEFKPGPIFANFVLADELNRTPPKTQSALLEAMEESTVTADGKTHSLPKPFFVVATQNPGESHGVYPLAESQLDRFMMRLIFSAPSAVDELKIYKGSNDKNAAKVQKAMMSLSEVGDIRGMLSQIHAEDSVLQYMTSLIRATRELPEVTHGVSVRGGIQFVAACRAIAAVRGREFVTPQDVRDIAAECLGHRLTFAGNEVPTSVRAQMIGDVLEKVPAPK